MYKVKIPDNNRLVFGIILSVLIAVTLFSVWNRAYAEDSLTLLELDMLGKKYANESTETRVSRLEKLFKQTTPKGTSLEYRLANLYSLRDRKIAEKSENDAVKAYNRGIDASSAGDYEKAIEYYQNAIKLNPAMIEAYNNLGNILNEVHKYNEAIEVYQEALKQSPNYPLLYRNLGVVYEKAGNIQEAMNHYRQYIKLSPEPDPAIRALVDNFDSQVMLGKSESDYVSVARSGSQGEKLVWPGRMNPIPVYVQLDPDQVPFLPAIQKGLKEWEEASLKRIKFREVSNPKEANIYITLKAGPLAHPNLEVGHARYDVTKDPSGRNLDWKVFIIVNTGERDAPIPLEERLKQVERLSLHEVGHAIGIWGHSSNPEDVMYSHPIVSKLSTRDVNTLKKLYGLSP